MLAGGCVGVVTNGGGGKVWHGVGGSGGVWSDGVKGQRKTRGEARVFGVSKKHDAYP